MPKIRCPGCRRTVNVNAQGKWYVRCSDCGASFQVYIVRQEPVRKRAVACPYCHYQESVALTGACKVKCSQCLKEFTCSG